MVSDHTSTVASSARVIATSAALQAIRRLVGERGPVMFFQSGGCCDGSLPICFELGEFVLSDHDVLLGDVGEGLPEGFSLPAGPDEHFVTRSRVFDPGEIPGEGAAEDLACRR